MAPIDRSMIEKYRPVAVKAGWAFLATAILLLLFGKAQYLTALAIVFSGLGTWVVAAFAVLPWIDERERRRKRAKAFRFRLLDAFARVRLQIQAPEFIDGLDVRNQNQIHPGRREAYDDAAESGEGKLRARLETLGELVSDASDGLTDAELDVVHTAWCNLHSVTERLTTRQAGSVRSITEEGVQHCRDAEGVLGEKFGDPIEDETARAAS